MSDPVADMLTRIRNAGRVKHLKVDVPASKLKIGIAMLLKKEGYVKHYKIVDDGVSSSLRIYLKRDASGQSGIVKIDRVSKPGRRFYVKAKDVKPVYNGMGTAILSTSYGLMTDKDAMKKNLGGEVLCTVW